jgi:hypothetical protein
LGTEHLSPEDVGIEKLGHRRLFETFFKKHF